MTARSMLWWWGMSPNLRFDSIELDQLTAVAGGATPEEDNCLQALSRTSDAVQNFELKANASSKHFLFNPWRNRARNTSYSAMTAASAASDEACKAFKP